MGRVSTPFGVKGWVKLEPFTATPESLVRYTRWWVEGDQGWEPREIEQSRAQGRAVAAKFAGCDDRDEAAAYRGRQVAVSRGEFPAAGENEFYWTDLPGLKVVNEQGYELGTVSRVFGTGANDVLVVEAANANERERLIPFVAEVVKSVDLEGRVIRVDWGMDY
jgi:16S rRNA processing protein RimM